MAKSTTEVRKDSPMYPFDKIVVRDEDNPRQVIDGIEELAGDIKKNGLLEPIGLRFIKNPKLTDDEKKQLGVKDGKADEVAFLNYGYRRYHAISYLRSKDSKLFSSVPFIVSEGTDKDAVFRGLNENIARKDVSPAELADKLYAMNVEDGLDIKEISSRIPTRSKGYLQALITLRKKLSEKAWEAFMEGAITFDVAREIQKAGGEAEQDAVLKAAVKATEGQEKKKKKRGGKKAAAEAAGNARPGLKDVKAKLEEVQEQNEEKKSNFLEGQISALRWVVGETAKLKRKKVTKK